MLEKAASTNGALAQLGERLLCKHQVIGSIPIGSTILIEVRCISSGGRLALRTLGSLERRKSTLNQRFSRDEDSSLPGIGPAIWSVQALLFDIVNGFFNRCRGDMCSSVADLRIVQATHVALL